MTTPKKISRLHEKSKEKKAAEVQYIYTLKQSAASKSWWALEHESEFLDCVPGGHGRLQHQAGGALENWNHQREVYQQQEMSEMFFRHNYFL